MVRGWLAKPRPGSRPRGFDPCSLRQLDATMHPVAELHVTTWDGYHTFHLRHNQKTHGRRGVSTLEVKGDAMAVHKAAAHEKDKLAVIVDSRKSEAYGGWRNYTGNNGKFMNEAARHPDTANNTDLKSIAAFDDFFGFAGVENSDPITVHRGVKGPVADRLRSSKVGDVFVEDGYLSTSADPKVASLYAQDGLAMEIRVPKGSHQATGAEWESELVYPRGTNLKVVNYDADRNTVVLDMLAS